MSYGNDDFGGILGTHIDDGGFQALTFTVDSVSSTTSIQAFAVGWNIRILNTDGTTFASVRLDTAPVFNGSKRKYYLPLSEGYSHTASTGEIVSDSIESRISTDKVDEYKAIVRHAVGSKFLVDAHIQKYTYSSSRTPQYLPVSPNVYADNMSDINSYFSEFSSEFKNNLPNNYFDLSKTFKAEPPDIKVNIYLPDNGTTIFQGESITFQGYGTNVDHLNGYVDGKLDETQKNPKPISEQMRYLTHVTLNELGVHTFQIKGSGNISDTNLVASETRKINVVARKVDLYRPLDGTTVTVGTEVPFIGFGTGVHHINGYVNGKYISTQNNPNTDIKVQMRYETTVKLDQVGDYTFQIKGSPSSTNNDSNLLLSDKHIVHVIAPPANSGNIHVKFRDYETNSEIADSAQTIPGVEFGKTKTIDSSIIDQSILKNYDLQGSYQTFDSTIPDRTKMTKATSQNVTLTSTNKDAYVTFWVKAKVVEPDNPPVPASYPPTAILNNTAIAYAGDNVDFDGSQSYDVDGIIVQKDYSLPGAAETNVGNVDRGTTWYATEGTYNIDLKVTDDSGLTDSTAGKVVILPPKPNIIFKILGDKLKENRKIMLDVSESTAPKKFPINWSLTTWMIEPIAGTGATGDYGVRFDDGTVYKNKDGKAQLYKNGTWEDTGMDFNSVLSGQKVLYFQARDSGQYKVTATLVSVASFDISKQYTNTATKTIDVVEDLPPVAAFSGPLNNSRDYESPKGTALQKYAIIPVSCTTKSPDGDPIGVRKWTLRYDSNNDGLVTDETTIYPYTGNEPFNSGMRLIVDGDRDPVCEIWSYEVGYYEESLEAFEDIPDNETVKELLLPGDFRSDYVKGW